MVNMEAKSKMEGNRWFRTSDNTIRPGRILQGATAATTYIAIQETRDSYEGLFEGATEWQVKSLAESVIRAPLEKGRWRKGLGELPPL